MIDVKYKIGLSVASLPVLRSIFTKRIGSVTRTGQLCLHDRQQASCVIAKKEPLSRRVGTRVSLRCTRKTRHRTGVPVRQTSHWVFSLS